MFEQIIRLLFRDESSSYIPVIGNPGSNLLDMNSRLIFFNDNKAVFNHVSYFESRENITRTMYGASKYSFLIGF